jgi:hypothetical protein
MLKQDVVAHFGTQEKVALFITEHGVPYGRTSIVMWSDLIPIKWALFLDKHSKLKFNKAMYQDRFEEMDWKTQ